MRIRTSTWFLALCLAVSPGALALSGCATDAEPDPELTTAEATTRPNPYPTVKLSDSRGRAVTYESRTALEKDVIDHGIDTFIAADRGGREPLGCMVDGLSISCWGFGWMCAAWIDDDGAGGQCWECEVAECD